MKEKFTAEILEKLKHAKSVEEMLAMAKERGIELEDKLAIKLFEEKDKLNELKDELLDKVAGGRQDQTILCTNCGTWNTWNTYSTKCDVCGAELDI